MVTVTPPSVVGGVCTLLAAATLVVSCVPKIVMVLPGETLTEDSDAALTIRRFWARLVLPSTKNIVMSRSFFIVPPFVIHRTSNDLGEKHASVGPTTALTKEG